MIPIAHPTNNITLGAPDGLEDRVAPLHTTSATMDDGMPVILSMWLPSQEERDAIAAGAGVLLSVMGDLCPPVALQACTEAQMTGMLTPRALN